MLVESVMTRAVVSVESGCSVQSALRLMRDGRFRHVPVTRAEHLIGIISDRELAHPQRGTVGELMHTDVITAAPDTPIEVAASLMSDNKIGALPVLDRGTDKLVGIVSQTDLLAALARLLGSGTPATRLELQLDDASAQLARVTDIAHRRQIPIVSLIAPPPTPGPAAAQRVILRVGTMAPQAFVEELRSAGIAVDAPERVSD